MVLAKRKGRKKEDMRTKIPFRPNYNTVIALKK